MLMSWRAAGKLMVCGVGPQTGNMHTTTQQPSMLPMLRDGPITPLSTNALGMDSTTLQGLLAVSTLPMLQWKPSFNIQLCNDFQEKVTRISWTSRGHSNRRKGQIRLKIKDYTESLALAARLNTSPPPLPLSLLPLTQRELAGA